MNLKKNHPPLIAIRRRCLLLVATLGALASCDENGDDVSVPPPEVTISSGPSNTDPSIPYSSIDLNNGLKGRVYVSGKSRYLDLDTGETVSVRGDSVYPSKDGMQIVEFYDDYRFRTGCGGLYSSSYDRIIIREVASGNVTSFFDLGDAVSGPMKLSPDGQKIALFWKELNTCYEEPEGFAVFTKNGELISRASADVNSFDWLPDNRLLFAIGQKIAVENVAGSGDFSSVADMSDVRGTPSRVTVSPDGTKVLFEMVYGGADASITNFKYRYATVWAVNIDGSNLRRISTTSRVDDSGNTIEMPQVNMPVWSPDGSTFLVTEDYTTGVNLAAPTVDLGLIKPTGLTYAIPADTAEQALPPIAFSENGVRPIKASDKDGKTGWTLSLDPFSTTTWVPSIPTTVLKGALPDFNGLPNRGLTGTIFRWGSDTNAVLYATDLASGTERVHNEFESAVKRNIPQRTAISIDAQRTAYYKTNGDYYSNDKKLLVHDINGRQLNSIPLITNDYSYEVESQLHFSPINSNHIAWIYTRDVTRRGVVVVDLSTRDIIADFETTYDELAWTREGDLLFFWLGKVYRSQAAGREFNDPQLLFEAPEPIEHPKVNLINNDIAYRAGGHIFASAIDGSNVRRLVANVGVKVDYPVWSPDGKFLTVKQGGDAYFIAADGLNAKIYGDNRTVGAFKAGESSPVEMQEIGYQAEWR